MDVEVEDIERRALQGDSEAQLALGRHFESQEDMKLARGWYARAAKQGSVAALRSLAINLLTHKPVVQSDGVNMLRSAADKGDAEAAYICGMLAAQDGDLDNRWRMARECLERAAGRGWAFARAQLEFLGNDFHSSSGVAMAAGATEVRSVFESPRIDVIERYIEPAICDWLIERARPRLSRAMVYDPATGRGRTEQARSNSSIAFNIAQSDLVFMLLRERIASTVGVALANLEPSSVLHYSPGQQFEPHYDFLDPNVSGYAKDVAENGQRIATFLLYLNDDYEGGETDFPKLGFRYKGRKGDALLFWNVTSSGDPEEQTLHAGRPTTAGEKWLLSQWLRQPAR